ncbi:LacI family transcriptional regulator, partial [Salmonella enterica subsp. enterica serovar Enteritidis]|nr:LacI family transcriptional regulator [Salmonella enterica subsp. enterica serovar Enteritidis]
HFINESAHPCIYLVVLLNKNSISIP